MLEIKHLRTLKQIKHTGNLSEAAPLLHITQSALSHQIRTIENLVGGTVFERKTKPLRFTSIGQRLLQLANDVLPTFEVAAADIRREVSGESGRLSIAVECHSCFAWLLPALEKYRHQHPDVEQDLTMVHSFNAIDALRARQIDLVISSDPLPVNDIVWLPLFTYECLLGVASDNSLADNKTVFAKNLENQTLLTYPVEQQRLDIFRRFLWPAGITPTATRHVELTAMILQLVSSGRGVCALPEWAYTETLVTLPVTCRLGSKGLFSKLFAAVRANEKNRDYIKSFVEIAQKKVSRL
ncbi:Transcriptional activator MetR [hydrothermal vent metagenome]|uniref:HTH-type transcriptional regulator MetR n=1 Tax=hydrothermal vent metagenome TaxID=652676 RepID=A0A3B0WGB3_9ZZZZ